jgi:hypothetical protein
MRRLRIGLPCSAVVRACLYALGSIGKASMPALETIRSTLENPGAGCVAERVI